MTTEPDEFELELLLAGAELPAERRAAIEAARGLDPARAEIEAFRARWVAHRPPLRAPVARSRRAWLAAGSGLVAAAAAALVAVSWPGESAERGFQARGVPAVDVWRVHDGAPVEAGASVQAGDQVGLALVAEADGFLSVASLQSDGSVAPLVVGAPVRAGQRFEVPGRIALDDWGGREWLVVEIAPDRPAVDAFQADVAGLLPAPTPAPGRWVVEVTRGRPPR